MCHRSRTVSLLLIFVLAAMMVPMGSRMTTVSAQTLALWASSTDGNWIDPANWSTVPNYPKNDSPNVGDSYMAVVDSPYSVNVTDLVTVSSLTIDSPEANVFVNDGVFSTPMIDINQGTLTLGTTSFGTHNEIRDATVSGGGTFRIDYGTLRDMHLAMDASVYFADIAGDLTLDGATVAVDRELRFIGNQMQSVVGNGLLKFENEEVLSFGDLTIGSDVEVEFTPGEGSHTMRGGNLVNHGTVRVFGYTRINADITNAGTIDVVGNARIDGNAWRNMGTVRVGRNASLTFAGSMTPDDIGTIIDEGASRISLGASVDNTGSIFDLAQVNPAAPISLNGANIRGGTLMSSVEARYEVQNSIVLDDVTVTGELTLAGGRAFGQNDLTLDDAFLRLEEISFPNSPPNELNGTGTLVTRSIYGNDLIIGEQITVRNSEEPAVSFPDRFEVTFKENRGTIVAEPDSDVIIGENLDEWTNAGLIRVPNGRLEFKGNYSIDDIGNIETPGSEVVLGGGIENAGKTIRVDQTTGHWSIAAQVYGGRIVADDGVEVTLNAHLTGVTLSGASRVGQTRFNSSALFIQDELILDDAMLSVPDGHYIYAERDDFGNAAPFRGQGEIVLLGSHPDNSRIEGSLSIEAGVVIRTGTDGGKGAVGVFQLPIDNDGVILAEGDDSFLVLRGDLRNTGTISAANGSTFQISDPEWTNQGTVRLDDARMEINSDSFENAINGLVAGTGELAISGEFLNNGEMAIGAPVRSLTIDGRVRLGSTGRVSFDLGGTSGGKFDTLQIDGDLFVGGQLEINLTDDFLLQPKHQFEIMAVSGFAFGQFEGLPEGALVGTYNGVDLFVSYSHGDGNDIAVYTEFPGDFNSDFSYTVADVNALTSAILEGNHQIEFDLTGDGLVDQTDLFEWLSQAGEHDLGPAASYLTGDVDFNGVVDSHDLGILINRYTDNVTTGWAAGDFNGDAIVDQKDLGLLLNNFQSVANPAAVPESSSFALWLSALLYAVAFFYRRAKRSSRISAAA